MHAVDTQCGMCAGPSEDKTVLSNSVFCVTCHASGETPLDTQKVVIARRVLHIGLAGMLLRSSLTLSGHALRCDTFLCILALTGVAVVDAQLSFVHWIKHNKRGLCVYCRRGSHSRFIFFQD